MGSFVETMSEYVLASLSAPYPSLPSWTLNSESSRSTGVGMSLMLIYLYFVFILTVLLATVYSYFHYYHLPFIMLCFVMIIIIITFVLSPVNDHLRCPFWSYLFMTYRSLFAPTFYCSSFV